MERACPCCKCYGGRMYSDLACSPVRVDTGGTAFIDAHAHPRPIPVQVNLSNLPTTSELLASTVMRCLWPSTLQPKSMCTGLHLVYKSIHARQALGRSRTRQQDMLSGMWHVRACLLPDKRACRGHLSCTSRQREHVTIPALAVLHHEVLDLHKRNMHSGNTQDLHV